MDEYKIRILSEEHSENVQTCLFKLGYKWGKRASQVKHLVANYLYCWEDGCITFDMSDVYFNRRPYPEIDLDGLLLLCKQPKINPHQGFDVVDALAYTLQQDIAQSVGITSEQLGKPETNPIYCSCDNRQSKVNEANNIKFYVCTNCNKEIV